jgi:hypothetical protein
VEEVKVQLWVADTRGTYWVVDGNDLLNPLTPLPSKTSYELVMEELEAEEDVELKKDTKRNQQEDNTKGLGGSTPWLNHHTKWPTRFKGILAITNKPPSASSNSRRVGPTVGTHHSVTIRWDGQFEERLYTFMGALRQMLEGACPLWTQPRSKLLVGSIVLTTANIPKNSNGVKDRNLQKSTSVHRDNLLLTSSTYITLTNAIEIWFMAACI